ncbi:MAG: uracil-DNA glycosylase [Thermoplasmata archaeon]
MEKRIVRGYGKEDADVFLIGEAPGAEEEKKGKPFVGRAGRVLDVELERNGISRDEVYVSNVVKERPPGNRRPTCEEIRVWLPDLLKEIEQVKPRILVLLGKTAAESILQREVKIDKEYGKVEEIEIGGRRYKAIISYHPASIFHSNNAKIRFRECIAKIREVK